ncbi:hypothetical protein [Bdellovibrio sp.]|uniref:hypothetical protein n=1 Tax=Bdellovibrio TaxID=958 RepID=UPI0032215EA0
MEEITSQFWRKCSSCKKPISFGAKYFVCSVSTCNNERTGYVFCSVPCFETHLPGARHRDAGAIEKIAPKTAAEETHRTPARIIVKPTSTSTVSSVAQSAAPQEVLIVASRLKEYIHARSEYNTSASVMDVLSDHVRIICDRAIENARADGRKTVMDRDFEFLKK